MAASATNRPDASASPCPVPPRSAAGRARLAGVARVVGRQARSESRALACWRRLRATGQRDQQRPQRRGQRLVQIGQPQGQRIGLEDVRCLAGGARVADPGSRCRWLAGPEPGRFEAPAWRAGGSRGRRGAAPRCATDARPPTAPPRAGRAPDATRRRHVAVAAPGRKPLSSSPVRHATPPARPLPSAPAGRSGAPSATLRLRPPAGRRAAARLPPG